MSKKRKIRVLRIIEYYGDQDAVNEAVEQATHGKLIIRGGKNGDYEVTAATVGAPPRLIRSTRIISEGNESVN